MSGISLIGSPERALNKAEILKSGLPWRSQDVAKVVEYLSRRQTATREWKWTRERILLQSRKLKRVRDLNRTLTSDMETEFGIYQAGIWPCFGAIFSQYPLFPSVWKSIVYLVSLYV